MLLLERDAREEPDLTAPPRPEVDEPIFELPGQLSNELRVAVFGAGFWARFQLAAWRELPGVRCIALCDRARERAEALARALEIPAVYDRPEDLFREYGLTAEECDMVRRRDWRAMIHYGVIFFVLGEAGRRNRVSNLHIYAAMRGQPLEEFLKTRNAPGALYSVGAPGGRSWEN